MPLVFIGGEAFDPNIPEQQKRIFAAGLHYVNGEWVPQRVGDDIDYIAEPSVPYVAPYQATADKGSSLTNTVLGTMQTASPGVMQNVISGGVWGGFDPSNMAGSLAALHAFALATYGSLELGTVRYSSEVLENEPTGVRPGSMERIVIPAWMRRERGSPL